MRGLARHAELLAGGGEIVTASARQAAALRSALGRARRASGETVWETPRILPYGAWLERAALRIDDRPALLEASAARRLWQRIVEESAAGSQLVSARAAAREAEQAFALLAEWQLALDSLDGATPERVAFRGWARQFSDECRRRGFMDRSALAALVLVRSGEADVGAARPVGWHGFAEFTPAQRALAAAFARRGAPSERLTSEAGPASCTFADAATPEAELGLIADWAGARLEADREARLGVIVPQPGVRADALARLLDERLAPALAAPGAPDARPYVIDPGRRLADEALVDAALLVLELGEKLIDVLRFGRALRSPYLKTPGDGLEPEARALRNARIDAELRQMGPRVLAADTIVGHLKRGDGADRALGESLAALRTELPPGRRNAAEWAERFPRALRAAGWPFGRPLGTRESFAADAFYDALGALAGVGRVLAPLSLAAARTELAALVESQRFAPPAGSARIEVLGALEDPASPFDALWVAGLTAERFPGAVAPNPFLPLALQRSLAMPGADAQLRLAEARAALGGWQRAAPELVLSCARRDGDVSLLRSGLVPALPPFVAGPSRPRRAAAIHAARSLEAWRDPALPPLAPGLPLAGGVRVLELQSDCPFRAGAELRLGAQALASPTGGFPRWLRGQLAHAALAEFWRGLGSQQNLRALDEAAREQRASAAVAAAFRGRRGLPPGATLAELEQRWLRRAILALAEYELARAPFAVLETEHRFATDLGGHALEFRPDRIDRLEDGATVVIDYKSGRSEPKRWEGERPDVMQLAAYAAFRAEPPAAVVLARLALAERRKFRGRAAAAHLLPDVAAVRAPSWAAQLAAWAETAERLARAFAAGEAAVDPAPGACERCALALLCRIEQRSLDDPEAGAAEEGTEGSET